MKNKIIKSFTLLLLAMSLLTHSAIRSDIAFSDPNVSVCNSDADVELFDEDVDDKPCKP